MIWDWFRRRRSKADPDWVRCPHCAEIQATEAVARLDQVCPSCGHHHPLGSSARVVLLADDGIFDESDTDLVAGDPLSWKAAGRYRDTLAEATKESGATEALRAGRARIEGHAVELALSEPDFLGASLGAAAGERLCRALDRAASTGRPFVLVAAGGGPRWAEGLASQVQLSRLADHRAGLYAAGAPFVALLVPPLPEGALLAFAASADLVFAEPFPGSGRGANRLPFDPRAGDPTGVPQAPMGGRTFVSAGSSTASRASGAWGASGVSGASDVSSAAGAPMAPVAASLSGMYSTSVALPGLGRPIGTAALAAAGLLDGVVPRASLKAHVGRALGLLRPL